MSSIAKDARTQGVLDWFRRAALRWAMIYFVSFICLDTFIIPLLSGLPGLQFMGWIGTAQAALWNAVIPWIGIHLLGRPIRLVPYGSEMLVDFVENLSILAGALVISVLWASLDRGREHERSFYEFTRILVRYTLAVMLLFYGIPKLFPCGFFACAQPALLMQPFGDLPEGGLLFIFFGHSFLYSFVIGIGETSGAILVLFRRTATLGAVILAGVLVNVVLLDVSYNVNVRILSGNLALMAIFLLAPDVQRIVNVMLGYAVTPAISQAVGGPKIWTVAGSIFAKILIAVWTLLLFIPWAAQVSANYRITSQEIPMGGYYQVNDFRRREPQKSGTETSESTWEMVEINANPRYINTRLTKPTEIYDVLHVRTAASVMKNYLLQIKRLDATHGLFYLTQCGDLDYRCRVIAHVDVSPEDLLKVHSKQIAFWDNSSNGISRALKPNVLRYVKSSDNVLAIDGILGGVEVTMHLRHLAQSPFQFDQSRIQIVVPDDDHGVYLY